MEAENNTTNNETQIENVSVSKKDFCTVTPISKTLALVLFIALPFVGFWTGVQYANKEATQGVINADDVRTRMSPDECIKQGGEIVNVLGGMPEEHKTSVILGDVDNMKCPCVCAVKSQSYNVDEADLRKNNGLDEGEMLQ